MAESTTCPHCDQSIPRVRQTQRCPRCGQIILAKARGTAEARSGRAPKFWQRMSLFQGEVMMARVILVAVAVAVALALLVSC